MQKFLLAGDRDMVDIIVRNTTAHPLTVSLQLRTPSDAPLSAVFSATKGLSQQLTLGPYKEKPVFIQLSARAAGQGTLQVVVGSEVTAPVTVSLPVSIGPALNF